MEEVGKLIVKGLVIGVASCFGREAAEAAIEFVKDC